MREGEHLRPEASRAAFAEVLAARKGHTGQRLGLALVVLAGFGASTGWTASLVWFAAYCALQLVEILMLRRGLEPLPVRAWVVLLVTNSTVFGSFAVLGCLVWPPWGFVGASLLLAGGVLHGVMVNVRSRAAFAASVSPYGVYCALVPLLAWRAGAPAPILCNVALGCFLIAASGVVTWRQAFVLAGDEAEARRELEERRREAEAAVEAKSAFIAMVSHELRTPLTAVAAFAARAQSEDAPEEVRRAARSVEEAGRMMRRLLDDLLDLAKLDADSMAIEQIVLNPCALLQDTVDFWRGEAARKRLTLELEGLDAVPACAAGDPLRIRQVLNNLLSNAVKFTDHGGVTVRAEVRALESRTQLSLTVVDSGRGLTPAQLAQLFQPFAQAGASVARTHGGTGLGLAISRKLARLMGGDLVADRDVGGGASFRFTVDLAPASAIGAAEPMDAEVAEGLRALVVDDHASNRGALAVILEPAGVQVTFAVDGLEALTLLAAAPFDLVLMDVTMAGLDGRETTRRLRRMPGPNTAAPVIGVTGHTGAEATAACLAAGMDAVVSKPIEPRALYAAISTVLAGRDTAIAAVA